MISKAQQRAVNKYNKKTYEAIHVNVKKGEREQIKDAILNMGYVSVNQFVIDAINEKIAREKEA